MDYEVSQSNPSLILQSFTSIKIELALIQLKEDISINVIQLYNAHYRSYVWGR